MESSLKDELVARLEKIPGVEHVPYPDRSDGFSGIHLFGKEIGHFHNFNELDLKLGKKLIEIEGLKHNAASKNHPNRGKNSQFIELPFKRGRDLDEIERLFLLVVEEYQK